MSYSWLRPFAFAMAVLGSAYCGFFYGSRHAPVQAPITALGEARAVIGRFMLYQHPVNQRAQFLVDTASGRVWALDPTTGSFFPASFMADNLTTFKLQPPTN